VFDSVSVYQPVTGVFIARMAALGKTARQYDVTLLQTNLLHGYRVTFAIESPQAEYVYKREAMQRRKQSGFGELSVRSKGRITSWNDDKGYGFISPLAGGKRIFIHVSALGSRTRRPEVNDVVTYAVSRDAQGRPCAANATLAGDKPTKKASNKRSKTAILFAVVFLAAIGVSAVTGKLSRILLMGYVALSLVTFVAYAIDKSAAKRGAWRTGEGTLLFLGLAGGWPGALIAQQLLRHKSRKTSFRTVFWITVLMNCAALAWLHTDGGRAAVQGLFPSVLGNQLAGRSLPEQHHRTERRIAGTGEFHAHCLSPIRL